MQVNMNQMYLYIDEFINLFSDVQDSEKTFKMHSGNALYYQSDQSQQCRLPKHESLESLQKHCLPFMSLGGLVAWGGGMVISDFLNFNVFLTKYDN